MAVRPIDANAMLNELRPVSFEAEHSAVLLSDVSKMMREWVERQPTLTPQNEWVSVEDRLPTDERPVPPSVPHSISRYAYAELRAFCRQYGEKKSKAAALAGVSSPALTGMPHAPGVSDPVTRAVERREKLLRDCAMIERAASAPSGGAYYHALILNCCHGVGYVYLDPSILPSSKRSAFFMARREFFWTLWNIKNSDGDF